MKALTVLQPWANAIAYGAKRVENRGWPVPPAMTGEVIAIHAGKTPDVLARPPLGEAWPAAHPMMLGAIIAVARISGCHLDAECWDGMTGHVRFCTPWSRRDSYHWELALTLPLAAPVPCRGYQKLWTVPEDVETAVRAQLEER